MAMLAVYIGRGNDVITRNKKTIKILPDLFSEQ
jgi:hypothetical protein